MASKFSDTLPQTFAQFCQNFNKFLIPPFQRVYDWGNKQINDLWECMTTNDNEYFIGNLVCLEASNDAESRVQIIDGQQRLFTITLFLLAVRDEFSCIKCKDPYDKDRVKNSLDAINNFLFFSQLTHPFTKELRFLPGKSNLQEIYNKLIKREIDADDDDGLKALDGNQIKYVKNYKTIRKLVKQYTKENSFDKLDELFQKITSLLFIVIMCNSDNDAYSIFEGLNATGIGLSVADLVKNAVLHSLRGARDKTIGEDNWEQIESIFEATRVSNFPKYLRHQWISKEGYVNTSKLFNFIKEKKLHKKKTNEQIINYTKELLHDAKIYAGFLHKQMEGNLYSYKKVNEEVAREIVQFRYLDIDQVYEVLLSFFNKFISTDNYTARQFCKDLKNLWIFAFRARVISVNPSEYERKFAEHCTTILKYDKKEMDRMSIAFYTDLRKLVNNDTVFVENFVTDLKYRPGQSNHLIYHLLTTIMLKDNKGIQISEPTIEHILPLDPTEWDLTKEKIKDFVNDIGNLTLLHDKDNKTLQNATMKLKIQRVYSKSSFVMNKKLASLESEFSCNPKEAIKKRGFELARAACDIFKIII